MQIDLETLENNITDLSYITVNNETLTDIEKRVIDQVIEDLIDLREELKKVNN